MGYSSHKYTTQKFRLFRFPVDNSYGKILFKIDQPTENKYLFPESFCPLRETRIKFFKSKTMTYSSPKGTSFRSIVSFVVLPITIQNEFRWLVPLKGESALITNGNKMRIVVRGKYDYIFSRRYAARAILLQYLHRLRANYRTTRWRPLATNCTALNLHRI